MDPDTLAALPATDATAPPAAANATGTAAAPELAAADSVAAYAFEEQDDGSVEVVDIVDREDFSQFVNPGIPIPPTIQRFTGITNAMVADAPGFDAIADTVRARLDGAVFVAHNARFDYGFIRNAFKRHGGTFDADVLALDPE